MQHQCLSEHSFFTESTVELNTKRDPESMKEDVKRPSSVKTVEQTEKQPGEQSHPQAGLQLQENKSWSTEKLSCEVLLRMSSKEVKYNPVWGRKASVLFH